MANAIREMALKHAESLDIDLHGSKSALLGAAIPPGSSGRLTYYLSSTKTYDVELLPAGLVGNIVNLKPINECADMYSLLSCVNLRLPTNGVFVGCLETQQQVKARLLKSWPWFVACLIYSWSYLYWRILVKNHIIQKVASFLGKRTQRMLNKAEVKERLQNCGFEIIDYREIEQLSYFFAMKTRLPRNK